MGREEEKLVCERGRADWILGHTEVRNIVFDISVTQFQWDGEKKTTKSRGPSINLYM